MSKCKNNVYDDVAHSCDECMVSEKKLIEDSLQTYRTMTRKQAERIRELKTENDLLRDENRIISLQQESNLNTIKYFKQEVDKLREALGKLIERIDINGGLGEYKGGPVFVMEEARKLIYKK